MNVQRKLMNLFWRPVVTAWLKKPRVFHSRGLRLDIPTGVFHPGFFYSSKILAGFIEGLDVRGKTLLDLGCGSGIVALVAACAGAQVTAVDIHDAAVSATEGNARKNGLKIEVLASDLFSNLQDRTFDVIAVNPPYYRKEFVTMAERAWNAGRELEYFRDFFGGLHHIMHDRTSVFLILSEDCDMKAISGFAAENRFTLHSHSVFRRGGESLAIFNIVITRNTR